LETPLVFLALLAAVLVCAVLAKRFDLPYPIVFVLGGLAFAFIPGLPAPTVDPNWIFFLVLPPLLFSGGWSTDVHDFKANARPIALLSIGLVAFTTLAVAWFAHAFVPGFPWEAAFVLGAIVSPPDAVAASAVFERFNVPRRVLVILEGEGLVNDGSALVIYRFAVAAAVTGAFSPWQAAGAFVAIAIGGTLVGILAGLAVEAVSRLLARYDSSDSLIENLILLLAPYVAYLGAESLHVSGVLATVAAGVYVSRRSSVIYGPQTRLIGTTVWNLMIYLFNAFAFLLIGSQVHTIASDPHFIAEHLPAAIALCVLVIVVRIVWVYPAAYLPFLLPHFRKQGIPIQPKGIVLVAWTGLRGIVSLAAALALPLHDAAGRPFPARNEIVFFTFCVILATLVGQGLSLIPLVRVLRISNEEEIEAREVAVRIAALQAGIERIVTLEADAASSDQWEVLGRLKQEYENRIMHLRGHGDARQAESPISRYDHEVQANVIAAERRAIFGLRAAGEIPDAIFRKIEYDLDLAQARVN
jgi:CPA1 family monovalent cation:H+ antiporter